MHVNTETKSILGQHTTLWQSLRIQKRVIYALLMREIITRYGRHNIGFLWLFAEPMIFTIGIAALWTATKSVHGQNIPIIGFAVTGYSSVLLWRNSASRCAKAVEANLALLFHRNVRIIDLMFSRLLLEFAGASISLIVLTIIFIATGFMEVPADIFLMITAWLLLAWFAVGLGLILGYISEVSEIFDRLWHAITYLLFPLSGAAFLVDWFPPEAQKYLLILPMVHGTEMLRHGYYGSLVITHENPGYLVTINLIFTFLGLFFLKGLNKKVTPE